MKAAKEPLRATVPRKPGIAGTPSRAIMEAEHLVLFSDLVTLVPGVETLENIHVLNCTDGCNASLSQEQEGRCA